MYIQPETNIRILQNVPLDNTYDHTIYFSSGTAQVQYFVGKQKYNLTSLTYQRVNRNTIRVGMKADLLYNCNYLMFQNSAYGTKWFFAFITAVEFINNECTEITFEIDVMQTWHFDYELGECLVEREHTATDRIGDHIMPEPVATGEYVYNGYGTITNMGDMVVCLAIVDLVEQSEGQLYDGIYGGASLWVYASTDVQGINDKVNEYTQKPDAIISMYMFPKIFIVNIPDDHRLSYGDRAVKRTVELPAASGNDTIDGYKPRNRKLYTYPYQFYNIDNGSGSSLALRYEFFPNTKPVVQISGTITQPVVAVLAPCSYKGVPGYDEIGGYTTLNTETIQLSSYPICSWNVDSYQAWVAQNTIPQAIRSVQAVAPAIAGGVSSGRDVASAAGGGMAGGALGLAVGAAQAAPAILNQAANVFVDNYTASIQADICKGSFNNGGANTANRKQQFFGGRCTVTRQYAEMIDDFFDMFGYSIKRVKVPNRSARPHWNYVKTIGCVAEGNMPNDDLSKVCSIYNNGITFWRNGNEVGNYSLDNTPV